MSKTPSKSPDLWRKWINSTLICLAVIIILLYLYSEILKPVPFRYRPAIKQAKRNLSFNETYSDPMQWNKCEISLDIMEETNLEKKHWMKLKNNISCFIEGTNLTSTSFQDKVCHCKKMFRGPECAFPAPVWSVKGFKLEQFERRSRPRKIVMGLVLTQEIDLTEVRLRSLDELVDVFILCEGNVSASGLSKPLHFFEAFKSGYLNDLLHKIIYVFHHDGFPKDYVKNGWLADGHIRNIMSDRGLKRIKGLTDDDMFTNFDADEIPSWEVVAFLKWFDIPNVPVKMIMRQSIFGFFYQSSNPLSTFVACTIGFLDKYCQNNAICLRRPYAAPKLHGYNSYIEKTGLMTIGTTTYYAGNECTSCFTAELIRRKHVYLQWSDGPSWSKNLANFKVDIINKHIKEGTFFIPNVRLTRPHNLSYPYFAPSYMIQNQERYKHLLFHPDELV